MTDLEAALKIEKEILAAIEQRTGLLFTRVQTARSTRETARLAFPVLREFMCSWPPRDIRAEIYLTFSRYSVDFADDLCAWYAREDDDINRHWLMLDLASVVGRKNAVRLWNWYRSLDHVAEDEEAQIRFLCRLW